MTIIYAGLPDRLLLPQWSFWLSNTSLSLSPCFIFMRGSTREYGNMSLHRKTSRNSSNRNWGFFFWAIHSINDTNPNLGSGIFCNKKWFTCLARRGSFMKNNLTVLKFIGLSCRRFSCDLGVVTIYNWLDRWYF